MKKIAVVFNGGTISMKIDRELNAAVPSMSEDEMMSMISGDTLGVNIKAYTFSSLPSPHVTPELMFELSRFIDELVRQEDIDGVVVTHGTDTLEETCYLINLTVNTDKPIVFTGSMRNGSELGYDGPSNLADSIRTAASKEARKRGVLVCFNGNLNSASEVTKANSMVLNAFRTPTFGPIGIVDDEKVLFYREECREESLKLELIDKKVAIIKCAAGMDSEFINYAVSLGYNGIVIEGLGRGNVPPTMVRGIENALNKGVIVILTSRCYEGRVCDSYGYLGGGKQLKKLGVIFAENLPSQKARIKLMVLLSANKNREYIKHSFEKDRYSV